jgi:tRNA (Thr-GGU) A37 N-methylase
VKFLSVKECEIEFLGVDMLDGTPLLDIKPYTGENLPDC